MTDATPPTEFEIELTAMAHGGRALGRHAGKTVFVPYTIPGERVLVRVTQDKGRIAFAEGIQLIEASADRVYPRCPHFGPARCGRCHWQHIDYPAQVYIKQDILVDQLSRVGGFEDALLEEIVQPILAAPEPWYYNHHVTFEVTQEGEPGYPGSLEDTVFLIEECHIIRPELLEMFDQLDLDFSAFTRLHLFVGSVGERMLVLHINDETEIPELETDIAASVNILLPDNEPVNLIGDPAVQYTVGAHSFRVTAGSAFRPNLSQLGTLAELVTGALSLTGAEAVLDLYAGVGFFSAFIAPRARLVTLVESYPPAATDADVNLAVFDNLDIIEGSVEDVLLELEQRYDCAVIDPSSEGLSIEAVDALGGLRIPRLVYVSSDPATLARDARRLVNKGYHLRHVRPIDLAPQTYYVDAVAVFEL